MDRETLERLSKEELIALLLARAAQVEALTQRVTNLEAKLGLPPKTPDNSSLPPSKGEKANRPDKPKKPRPGPLSGAGGPPRPPRRGGGRRLPALPCRLPALPS